MKKTIAVLAGDGIGPEITDGAIAVLNAVAHKFGHEFTFEHYPIGGCAIDCCGVPLPPETVEGCLAADSVLLGAVGGYKWDGMAGDARPEAGLLGIRKAMGLYSNIRPARLFKQLADASPLKKSLVRYGIEIIVVRELTGGIYFGERGSYDDNENGATAWDTEKYSVREIERITEIACRLAANRSKKIVSVDKANVLESSRLWRKTVHAYAKRHYPEIVVEDMLVDNCAMQIFMNTAQCGSAPDIAGRVLSNPIATVLSCAMMLRDSFGLNGESAAVETAVGRVLEEGYRTADIFAEGMKKVGCREMARLIAERV